jgi:signal transduction histidine kinase/CheY-like chemotaxis protein/HAMP domain-containing protein
VNQAPNPLLYSRGAIPLCCTADDHICVMKQMTSFSSLRVRLVGTVFLAIFLALMVLFCLDSYQARVAAERGATIPSRRSDFEAHVPWAGFAVGVVALGAAWFGGERFILRQVRVLSNAAHKLESGDFTSRTGLSSEGGELGELARRIDAMAESVEQRVQEREKAERTLVNRAFQQTVIGALGQFALVTQDFGALLNQAVILVSQTLEVEYCHLLELLPDEQAMVLRAGVGWKDGEIGAAKVTTDPRTQAGFTLAAGEPVVVEELETETRFRPSPFLVEHGVVSGVTVAITGHGMAFGILGAHTTHRRKFSEDEVHFLLSVATVLAMAAARNRAQAELNKLATFAQLNPNPAMELAAEGPMTYCNKAATELAASIGRENAAGLLPSNIGRIVQTCLSSRQSLTHLETQLEGRTLSWSFHPVPDRQLVHCYVEDITDRLSLEAQLRQAQKMESVGQLAAGVAHDFNNMLTVIEGHSGMLLAKTGLPDAVREAAQAIFFAAERAAGLTRQLLMFSRKNVMQPKLLDLREVVGNMNKMLQRLLGETVKLEFSAPAEIPLVQGDTGMMEQVLMNLVVNARDAMPKGGTLNITCDVAEVEAAYLQNHHEARCGTFVRLSVADAGCGMDEATMARIFEPFFTTKEVGKGTGLGLATVYGIVKQHEGWIEVASEVGKGTTFHVFFPASSEPVEAKPASAEPSGTVPGGHETILIVEDEPVLRDLAHVILESSGYNILEAGTGVEAVRVWEANQNTVDLLLTDMVMPEGMSGMELAQTLRNSKPNLKVIFASGYSMEDLDTAFIRKGRAMFLQKPYTHFTLAKAVRDCLDE